MREVGWPPDALAKSAPPEGRSATFDLPSRVRFGALRQLASPLPTLPRKGGGLARFIKAIA